MATEAIKRLMRLFEGFAGAHGTHGEPTRQPDSLKWEIKRTARTLREPVTEELWEKHVSGERPLGIITIREDGCCVWGSIDYDAYDVDIFAVISKARALKMPLVPCRSKSGGLHLFLFMKDWTPASAVQSSLNDMAAQLGIAGSEVFPKQTAVLAERGDLGSWMVMPYFGGTFKGKLQMQVGLKEGGEEMSLLEFVNLAERARQSEEDLAQYVRKRTRSSGGSRRTATRAAHPIPDDPDAPFADGPPCLQSMTSHGAKVGKGVQSDALFHMGVYYKRKFAVGWEEQVELAAANYLDPPGRADATATLVKQLDKKEYQYKCKYEPMKSYCNAPLCRSREFGVGDEGDYPVITGISKMDSDPPIWFVEVSGATGGTRLEMSTEDLFTYTNFCRVCLAQADRVYSAMSQKDWLIVLKAAVSNVVSIPVGDEVRRGGRFVELLSDFCNSKQKGEQLEDLFSGRPYFDAEQKLHYFRLQDVEAFLVREGLKNMTRGQIAARVKELKGEFVRKHVKERFLRCCAVPESALQDAPELSTPRRPEEGV